MNEVDICSLILAAARPAALLLLPSLFNRTIHWAIQPPRQSAAAVANIRRACHYRRPALYNREGHMYQASNE
ncbi:hypothetical protein KCP69_13830 [Salmonella enterica subsp. enterica]|nr:hypothetical protein KCP69_13830 [Salmonella enterica subsp. enterica]